MTRLRTNRQGTAYVIGPAGAPLTLADLPPAGTSRWVIRRKAEVVAAVRGGLIAEHTALARYDISREEFAAWVSAVDRHGMAGLRVTRIKEYREARP